MTAALKHWLAQHFNTSFYLAKYPDVQRAGIKPFQHYKLNGWKEGRDPSAYFSSSHYLSQCKEIIANGVDPLTHYFYHGQQEGLSPHPFLSLPDKNSHRIGAVILDEACRSQRSVSKGNTLTINASILSSDDDKNLLKLHNYLSDEHNVVTYVNQAVSYLNEQNCSHIYFCYSEDQFTFDGLQQLLECKHPIVAPTLLDGHGAQFLTGVGDCYSDKAFETHVKLWRRAFSKRLVLTSYVQVSHSLINNLMLQQLNGFDENYIDFSAALADFCMRAKQIGVDVAVARHCVGRSNRSIHDSTPAINKPLLYQFCPSDKARLASLYPSMLLDLSLETNYALHSDTISKKKSYSRTLRRFQNTVLQKLTQKTVETAHEASAELLRLNQWQKLVSKEVQSFNANEDTVFDLPFAEPIQLDFDRYIDPDEIAENRLFCDIEKAIVPFMNNESETLRSLLSRLAIKLSEIFCQEAPILFCCGHHDPLNSNPNDGYVKRIRAIDSVAPGRIRFYLNFNATEEAPIYLVQLSEKLWILNCRVDLALGRALLEVILNKFDLIYVHSPLAIPNSETAKLLCTAKPPLFFDAHGAVPEELEMAGEHELTAKFAEIESIIVSEAQYVICVSNAMALHFRQKYEQPKASFLTLPVVSDIRGKRSETGGEASNPVIMYSGGVQPWQCLPKMCRFLVEMKGKAEYTIMTPAVEEMRSILSAAGETVDCVRSNVISVASEDVEKWLSKGQYGILLREDSTVNHVSCPTKLIEYLACDLVPILESANIGDFKEFDFKYLNLESVLENGFPLEKERLQMVKQNREAMSRFHSFVQNSWQDLRNILRWT